MSQLAGQRSSPVKTEGKSPATCLWEAATRTAPQHRTASPETSPSVRSLKTTGAPLRSLDFHRNHHVIIRIRISSLLLLS